VTEIPLPEPAAGGRFRPTTASVIRAVVLVAGLIGIALAVRAGADEVDGSAMPSPAAMVAVLLLAVTSTMCAARGWSSLLPTVDRALAHEAVYASQLAKYLPIGGIAQAAAQLGLTASSGASAASVGAAWVVAMISAVAAASMVGIGVVAVPGAPAVLRIMAVAAVGSLVFLHPAVLRWTFGFIARHIPRLGVDESHIPQPREVARCLAWSVGNQLGFALAMAVAVTSVVDDVSAWQVATGAALAWLIGFVVVVLPGGVGLREAVLAAVVPAPTAALLAGSLAVRLAFLAGECLLVGAAAIRRRRSQRSAQGLPPVPG
jgi:glycosyltransferase 2 family protein